MHGLCWNHGHCTRLGREPWLHPVHEAECTDFGTNALALTHFRCSMLHCSVHASMAAACHGWAPHGWPLGGGSGMPCQGTDRMQNSDCLPLSRALYYRPSPTDLTGMGGGAGAPNLGGILSCDGWPKEPQQTTRTSCSLQQRRAKALNKLRPIRLRRTLPSDQAWACSDFSSTLSYPQTWSPQTLSTACFS